MSSKEWISQQRRKVDQLVTLFPKAVATTHSEVMRRIYEEGNLDGRFQYNDTTPIYVNPDDAPRSFKPEGKPKSLGTRFDKGLGLRAKKGSKAPVKRGADTFKRKTKYFKSYKAFRAAMGRETSFVNLDLNGLQRRDNASSLSKLSANRWAVGFKNHANTLKWEGQVKKYGPYHKLTPKEHGLLRQLITDQRRKLAV